MVQRNSYDELKWELCNVLTRINAMKFGMFTLSDGRLSPYNVDLRIVPSFPEEFTRVQKLYHHVAINELNLKESKRLAGIPTAGIPFASILAFSLNKPFLYVRREATHGRERKVEGILNPGDTVLLVDDLIATGRTILSAVEVIRSEGGVVQNALVLIDRQEGGRAVLEAQGVNLHYFIRMDEAARILYEMGTIEKDQLSSVLKQIVS